MKTLKKLISELAFNIDEYCEIDLILLRDAIIRNLNKLSQHNKSFGEINIIPLHSISADGKLRNEIIQNLGSIVSFLHTKDYGTLIGIAEDNMDYYYVIRKQDGTLHYVTCVDSITSSR